MVQLTRIYTRGGDKGRTSLGDGTRVSKDNLRIKSIGEIDEVNASIGVARLYCSPDINDVLKIVQNDLFDLGADLCIPKKPEHGLEITAVQVEKIEKYIDQYNTRLTPLTSFVLPGGSQGAAYIHLARTVTRRAERTLCALESAQSINKEVLRYINRLSDLLFVFGRILNNNGIDDVLWHPGGDT